MRKTFRMSFFGASLTERLQEHGASSRLAGTSGLDKTQITRIRKGEKKVTPDDLTKILRAFPSAKDREELIAAYVRDYLPDELAGVVEIVLTTTNNRRASQRPQDKLDRAIARIRTSPRREALTEIIERLLVIP